MFTITTQNQTDLQQFVLAYPTTLAPIVGQQITRTSTSGSSVDDRITLMRQRAVTNYALVGQPGAKECDLVVKGTVGGAPRGWLMSSTTGFYMPDKAAEAPISDAALRALADTPGQELTFTCVPPGSGVRLGIDRDLDGTLDGDENTLPGDGGCTSTPKAGCASPGKSLLLLKDNANDDRDKLTWKWVKGTAALADFGAPDTTDAYALCLYGQGGALLTGAAVPAGASWRNLGPKGFKYVDPTTASDGMLKVVLKPGTGKAKLLAKGKGANLTLPSLPLTLPVRVQLQGNDHCWGDVYTALGQKRSDATQFKGNGGSPSGAFLD